MIKVSVPVRVVVDAQSATRHLDHLGEALDAAASRAMLTAKAVIERTCDEVAGGRVHDPVVSWSGPGLAALNAETRHQVEALIHTVLTTVGAKTLPGAFAPRATGPARIVTADVVTTSVGEAFAAKLTPDELRQQAGLIVGTLEHGAPGPGERAGLELNLAFLEDYGAAHGVALPAATAYEFRRALAVHLEDVKRQITVIKQLSAGLSDQGDSPLPAVSFRKVLDWHADQLDWVVETTGRAATLVGRAEAGGDTSARDFAEAGKELTAAIFGLRILAILLTYEDFLYEMEQYPGFTDLPRRGVRMVHDSLDLPFANLRKGLPGSVDAAIEAVEFNWRFDFGQMKVEVETQMAAYARLIGWLNIAMLAWTAYDIWMIPVVGGGGGTPRIGGFGGPGGAGVAVADTVMTSAESLVAIRRLVKAGVLAEPRFVKLLGGRTGEIQAPPKPIEAAGKKGAGKDQSKTGKELPAAKPDPHARPAPGLPTAAEDAFVRRYLRGLNKLREAVGTYRRVESRRVTEAKKFSTAKAARDSAIKELDALEREALGPEGGELPKHLQPHIKARPTIEKYGPEGGPVGERVECDAVRLAPKNLRGMDLAEIEKVMQRPPDHVDAAFRPPGGVATAHQRLEWHFEDGSKLIVDFPRALGGRELSADLSHAELHGPKGERLDQDGIVAPERSISTHMTITDRLGRQENHFGPARKGR